MATSSTPPFSPPLLNSSNPWATTIEDLRSLYNSPHTGAITVRTSLLKGFAHDPSIHQYVFFNPSSGHSTATVSQDGKSEALPDDSSSLNTLGYSPTPLQTYLEWIKAAALNEIEGFHLRFEKPIILSVTGTAVEVAECYKLICDYTIYTKTGLNLMMEINLSCPNIPDKPPPAYDAEMLAVYLAALAQMRSNRLVKSLAAVRGKGLVPCGIKTPPYTYQGQYEALISALEASTKLEGGCPISFIAATNTLGSCLVMKSAGIPALKSASGEGIGGMAGPALHPLALGNVKTIRKMLDASTSDELKKIWIIGVGGVSDGLGYSRMRSAGASAVAVGTALGREGVKVFKKISSEVSLPYALELIHP